MKRTKKILMLVLCVLLVGALAFTGCDAPANVEDDGDSSSTTQEGGDGEKKFKVGFANSSLDNPWRISIQNTIEEEFAKYPEVELITNEAGEDPIRLNNNIEDMISQGVDLILCCTVESEPFEVSAELCQKEGIPLILVDRGITSGNYTCFIQQSNYQIGYDAADWAAEQMVARYGEEKGKVVELQGVPGNLPAEERKISFHDQVEKEHPGLEIVAAQPTDYSRANSLEVMENILQSQSEIDVVYTHEDEIALGAIKALEEVDRLDGVLVIGNGGSKDAIEAVKEGKMACCMLYSPIDFGRLAVETAMKYLNGEEIEKDITFTGGMVTAENVDQYVAQLEESGSTHVSTIEE